MSRILAIALLALSVGCTTVTIKPENPRTIWCSFNQPRPPLENADTVSRAAVDEYNAYQDKGIEWCKWKIRQ